MQHEPEPEGFFAHLHGDDLDAEVAARDLSDDLAELEGERDRAERKYASARELLLEIKRWLEDPGAVLEGEHTYWSTRIAKRLERLDAR